MSLCLEFSHKIRVVKNGKFVVKRNSATCCLVLNSVKSPHKIEMPECSSEFAVGDCVVAKFLLLCYKFCDFVIYDFVVLVLLNFSAFVIFLCVFKRLRS